MKQPPPSESGFHFGFWTILGLGLAWIATSPLDAQPTANVLDQRIFCIITLLQIFLVLFFFTVAERVFLQTFPRFRWALHPLRAAFALALTAECVGVAFFDYRLSHIAASLAQQGFHSLQTFANDVRLPLWQLAVFTLLGHASFAGLSWMLSRPALRFSFEFPASNRLASQWTTPALAVLLLGIAHYALTRQFSDAGIRALHRYSPWPGLIPIEASQLASMELTPADFAAHTRRATSKSNDVCDEVVIVCAESFRSDVFNAADMPLCLDGSLDWISNGFAWGGGNATYLSWYALLSGQSAMTFDPEQVRRSRSEALAAFTAAGGRLNVYSGSTLRYCRLDEFAFGPKRSDTEFFLDPSAMTTQEPSEMDLEAVNAVCRDLESRRALPRAPRLTFVFLESTHWGYSWPSDFKPPHSDFADSWNPLKPQMSPEELRLIKNRYRNSVSYLDSLLRRIIVSSQKSRSKIAVIFTGDHGEEFGETGLMLHGRSLNAYQCRVPLAVLLPAGIHRPTFARVAAHPDILPTAFELLNIPSARNACTGSSLFTHERSYAIIAGNNSLQRPLEFALADDEIRSWMWSSARFDRSRRLNRVFFQEAIPADQRKLWEERVRAALRPDQNL